MSYLETVSNRFGVNPSTHNRSRKMSLPLKKFSKKAIQKALI